MEPKLNRGNESFKDIYKQVCDEHRFYGDMRFKQLSLYGVITALLINAMNSKDVTTAAISMKALCLIALLSTSVLWIMEVRSSSYGYYCRKIRDQFETSESRCSSVGIRVPSFHWTLLNATNVVLILYVFSYVFWLWRWCIAVGWQAPIRSWLMTAWFLILVAFSSREYWQRWRELIQQWRW